MKNNHFTLLHINGKYYIYTVTYIGDKVLVNIERVG